MSVAAPPIVTSFQLADLVTRLDGELLTNDLIRKVYATDASAYQQTPLAVAIPRTTDDLRELILFAATHGTSLIPRTAGTSLAGQVVGGGIVVDVSEEFTRIIEVNADARWVRLQPGVIRNELNAHLQPFGLLFGPETSTQNRAMVGGMLGNNSCGSNSIKYGSVRDNILEVTALLADGSLATFGPLTPDEFAAKCDGPPGLETDIYCTVRDLFSDQAVRSEIAEKFPKPSIHRRNTGYALDALSQSSVFSGDNAPPINLAQLIAGSEGTLCFVTEMKLKCEPLPPPVVGLLCAHFETLGEALRATQIAVRHDCFACELIDHHILDCTKRSIEHRANRFFLVGEPEAVIVVEMRADNEDSVREALATIEAEMRDASYGYAYPVLTGEQTNRIWDLRKAGLGLLGNIPGDAKPAPVIEDTAVDVDDLPEYIEEVRQRLQDDFGIECVHYAHAGSGEIHIRPVINLKTSDGHRQFRGVAEAVAEIVQRYRGSLSGEHGDGRLRGEFLKQMIGEKNYEITRCIKQAWDPQNIFNPGKIIDTPPMDTSLRYAADQPERTYETVFDWSSTEDVLRAAEMCNGSGDCRKTHHTGGTMCPSYMATRRERDTTRARANMLRQVLTNSTADNPFDSDELYKVLDLCLSCKGCKSECPSTVDMAKLKAEFLEQYHKTHGPSLRSRVIAGFAGSQRWASLLPKLANLITQTPALRRLINRLVGFHPERTLPPVARQTLHAWFAAHKPHANAGTVGEVWLFCDEFTNYLEPHVGIAAVELLEQLGYRVEIPPHRESGRSALSKGFVSRARDTINANVAALAPIVSEAKPLIGLEPSALLTYRDESIDLAKESERTQAEALAANTLLLEELLKKEHEAGRIGADAFTSDTKRFLVHGHCFQKALVGMGPLEAALRLPTNAIVEAIPSGCCGMAGSFGYEREHFELSQQIGELVLFPAVRSAEIGTVLVANGTSCRHQIHDGTGHTARHLAEVLRDCLKQ